MTEKLSTERLGRFNPDKPMENRITDLGPRHFWQYFPPRHPEELWEMEVS